MARKSWQRFASLPVLVLVLVCLLDMASFRAQVYWTLPAVDPEDLAPGVFKADRIPYLPQRTHQPQDGLASARSQIFTRPISTFNNAHYTVLYEFARMDPWSSGVPHRPHGQRDGRDDPARGGVLAPYPTDVFLPLHDEGFMASLGCDAPKLRLVQRFQVARTESGAKQLFASLLDPAINRRAAVRRSANCRISPRGRTRIARARNRPGTCKVEIVSRQIGSKCRSCEQ